MTGNLIPNQLRCEHLTNPLGIDVARPRLSWALHSERRAQRQTAYQIIVASDEERLGAGEGDLWDTGRVAGSQSTFIPYGGPELRSEQRSWWAVRAWDSEGNVSGYSEPAWWEMGLLRREGWQGGWIGLQERVSAGASSREETCLPPSPYLRTSVNLTKLVRRARVYVTAKGLYELRINGRRVGDAVLTPGWTDYDRRIQYQTYDVGDLLREGQNVLGAILGTGWYSGYVGMGKRCKNYGARPQLLLQLAVEYADGSAETVVSDGSWRGRYGPILSSDLLMGEVYDAGLELDGWDAPGYEAPEWEPVEVVERNGTLLVADRAQPIRVMEELTPREIRRLEADTQIVDLGQNMVGWIRLRVRSEAGTRVRLRFAEILNPDGTLYIENLRNAGQTDEYILRGDGPEVFEPRFTFHGFRYVEVTGYPGELTADAVTGCVAGSDTPAAGTFECSNAMVNQLQRNIDWGQRGNFLSIPTDCPQRDERLGWMGDAQIFVRTACCNRDVAAFFAKWMMDVEDAQSPSGAFPDVAPRMNVLTDGTAAWGDAGIIVPWTIYRCYGDRGIVERHYEAMTRWMDYLQRANPDGLWTARLGNRYGDWLALDVDAPKSPADTGTPKELLATAYYAYDAHLMSRMARAIGRNEDAERYASLFDSIKEAFIQAYVSPDGRVTGETQTGYVLALHMDLLPDDLRAAAARYLVDDIERRGGHLSTGFVGVGYLCPVLTAAGYADVAFRLLTNDTYPSWGYSIKHGATTIWERWDGWTEERGFQNPDMNSFNHYSLGSVGEWLYRSVAGIDLDPDRPGYEHIVIRPQVGGGLTRAKAEYRSIRGTIESGWSVEDGRFTLGVSIPANTTATVYLPATDASRVTESGDPIADAPGVELLGMGGGRLVIAIQSGSYRFTVN